MGNNPSKPSQRAELGVLQADIRRIDRDVRSLKDLLNVHDNWNSTIVDWFHKKVEFKDSTGEVNIGILRWSDRYNIMIEVCTEDQGNVDRVFSKGGLIWIASCEE